MDGLIRCRVMVLSHLSSKSEAGKSERESDRENRQRGCGE